MVNLALLQEVVIEYGDNVIIGMQLDYKSYCYYTNKEKNQSSLSNNSKRLYKWVKEKLKV